MLENHSPLDVDSHKFQGLDIFNGIVEHVLHQ